MAITFYYSPRSSATRVGWVLEELEIPYEKVKIDLQAGEQKKPEYLRINPNGKVPALVDGQVKLFEALAIVYHLGERYGVDKGLWPAAGTDARSEAYAWTAWLQNELLLAVREVAIHGHDGAVPGAPPVEERARFFAQKARASWEHLTGILDTRLEGRAYVLGEAFTFADLLLASGVNFGGRMMGLPLTGRDRVAAWVAQCMARPAVARALALP